MNFIIISGESGAGKSQAKKVFEDYGYYCVDNLPPSLIPSFVDLLEQSAERIENIALVIDVRGGKFFKDLEDNLEGLKQRGYTYKIFYFEAGEDVILKRFKEARRTHPLDPNGRLENAIRTEKEILSALREQADFVINTSHTTQAQLKAEITKGLDITERDHPLTITFLSFGFKKGLPLDADFVFDVRFLPNPFYIESLRGLTGECDAVQEYVMHFEESKHYFDLLVNLLDFAVPQFAREGRSQLIVAIGCTGGQHRSVTFVNRLAEIFRARGYAVEAAHREIKSGSVPC